MRSPRPTAACTAGPDQAGRRLSSRTAFASVHRRVRPTGSGLPTFSMSTGRSAARHRRGPVTITVPRYGCRARTGGRATGVGTPELDGSGLTIMSRHDCLHLLSVHPAHLGRLAVVDDTGQPLVFSVNFRLVDEVVVFLTGAGTKLASVVRGSRVAFEADDIETSFRSGWSVLVQGSPRRSTSPASWSTCVAWDCGPGPARVQCTASACPWSRSRAAVFPERTTGARCGSRSSAPSRMTRSP